MGNLASFIVYFRSFQTNIITIKKCPSSMPGFEPTTFEQESPPITTGPGLPPIVRGLD